MDYSPVHVIHILVLVIETQIKRNLLPPWGPDALRSSASGTRAWAWRWLCTPTPEYHQWSSGHLEASQSSAVQL